MYSMYYLYTEHARDAQEMTYEANYSQSAYTSHMYTVVRMLTYFPKERLKEVLNTRPL